MNLITCPECRNECHRREYRKQTGGLHALCKRCRDNLQKRKAYSRKKLLQINQLSQEEQQASHRAAVSKALVKEFKKATRLNRNRIKALEDNNKPTRATKMWLNKRRALQQAWIDGLNDLLIMVHRGDKTQSLSEYMENYNNADNNTGFRDLL